MESKLSSALIAEFIGTFALIFIGVGSIVIFLVLWELGSGSVRDRVWVRNGRKRIFIVTVRPT